MVLPRLTYKELLPKEVLDFARSLKKERDFKGEIRTDTSQRVVHSLDNSIYELIPQAVIYPRTEQGISAVLRLLKEPSYRKLSITAKGGGTSTNGQCLSSSLILDTSKYMNQILSLDLKAEQVRVQSGLVLDTLQRYLRDYGYTFAPTTSSSSRVTLGGMIATDAAGIGSAVHGKTSDHLKSLNMVLWGGEVWSMKKEVLENSKGETGISKLKPSFEKKAKHLSQICLTHQEDIHKRLPQLPRSWSGYTLDLLKEEDSTTTLDLPRFIAGSEGTLGVVSECTLRITKLKEEEAVVVVYFKTLGECLRSGSWVLSFGARAVELLDHRLIGAARRAGLWPQDLSSVSATEEGTAEESCQLVQFQASSLEKLGEVITAFETALKEQGSQYGVVSYKVGLEKKEVKKLWDIRKKSVPLFAGDGRERAPYLKSSAFVEDVAVHPKDLPEFLEEFRKILDDHGLVYGMYGHLDAGCVHVRPKLDYRDPKLMETITKISKQVFDLTQKYGGVLWGEHGKGFRSEYLHEFLGAKLHRAFRQVKELFDPYNQLNPQKICTPLSHSQEVPQVDEIPLRAQTEQNLDPGLKETFSSALSCDGNGLCFRENQEEVMCPSYRATADRLHSPKGRAGVIRAWIKALSDHSYKLPTSDSRSWIPQLLTLPAYLWQTLIRQKKGSVDFSHEVYEALDGCLSCNACTSSCPLHVDIPTLKSRFLALYHQKYPRKIQDYAMGWSEQLLPQISRYSLLRHLYNLSLKLGVTRALIEHLTSMKHLPTLAPGVHFPTARKPQAWILGDLTSEALEPGLSQDLVELFELLQISVGWMPYRASGKSWALRGWLTKSKNTLERRRAQIQSTLKKHAPTKKAVLVGLDPAFAFFYQQDYRQHFSATEFPYHVLTLQEFLLTLPMETFTPWKKALNSSTQHPPKAWLFEHCQESAHPKDHGALWVEVFSRFGLSLNKKPVGCCGLAGFWGHQKNNIETSQKIYDLHWKNPIKELTHSHDVAILATGSSCRMQIKRFDPQLTPSPLHPISYLKNALGEVKEKYSID